MAKPSGPLSVNTGNALGALVTHCWCPADTDSGTALPDLVASGTVDGTLSSGAAFGTNTAGDAVVLGDTNGDQVDLASSILLSNPFSIAWRAYQDPAGSTMPYGDPTADDSLAWYQNGTSLSFRMPNSGGGYATPAFSSLTAFTSQTDNYLMTVSAPSGGVCDVKVYKNGTLVDTVQVVEAAGRFKLKTLMQGHSSSSFSLKGGFDYLYVFGATVLDATQASTLHSDPYAVFSAPPSGTPSMAAARRGIRSRRHFLTR